MSSTKNSSGITGRLSALAFLFLVLAIARTISAYSQPSKVILYDADKVRTTLDAWSKGHKSYKKERITFLFTTSVSQCSGCGASAINFIIEQIQKRQLDVNTIVVIASDMPKDGLALRSLFKTPNVSEDLEHKLESVFHATKHTPDLFVVRGDGSVLHRVSDIQHDQANVDSIALEFNLIKLNSNTVKLKTAQLYESDDYIIPQIASPKLNPKEGIMTFIEPKRNLIYVYGLDGRRRAVYGTNRDLDFYFKNPNDTSSFWRDLSTHYASMTKLEDIVRDSGDTIQILAKMFTGYDTLTGTSGRRRANFRAGRALVDFVRGKFANVTLLPSIRYLVRPPTQKLSSGRLVAPCIWGSYYMDTAARRQFPDSLMGLLVVNRDLSAAVPLLSLEDLGKEYGRVMYVEYVKWITAIGNESLFYLDDGNGVFLRCVVGDSSIAYTRVEPGGTLRSLFSAPNDAVPVSSTSENDSIGTEVSGMECREGELFILLHDHDALGKKGSLVLQRYDEVGKYLGEYVLPLKEKDSLVEAQIAGFRGDHLVLVTRWKNTRWKILEVGGIVGKL